MIMVFAAFSPVLEHIRSFVVPEVRHVCCKPDRRSRFSSKARQFHTPIISVLLGIFASGHLFGVNNINIY